MRAIKPVESGHLMLNGFRIAYDLFGDPAAPAVLLLPAWQIVHSRMWKMQVPFLARSFRVITYDPPGNGGGEKTCDLRAFEFDRIVDQGIGLLKQLGVDRASVIGFSRGCAYGLAMAARYADHVDRLILIANGVSSTWGAVAGPGFWQRRTSFDGWERINAHYWLEHYPDWLEFFFSELFPEPHSTKAIDDCISWGLDTTPEVLVQTMDSSLYPQMPVAEAVARVRCPVLIVHGAHDRRMPIARSRELATIRPDWVFIEMEGCGHAPHVRDPVKVNLLIRNFLTA